MPDQSPTAPDGDTAEGTRKGRRSRRRKKRAIDGEDAWAPAAPWMRAACELGIQLGGRTTVDHRIAEACPCCFGTLTGRGFAE